MISIVNVVVSPVVNKSRFLLIKRIKPPYVGFWCLPGGKIEFEEHIKEAIAREIYEEAGIKVKFIALRGIVSEFLYTGKRKTDHFMIWVCDTKTLNDQIKSSSEGRVRWFSKNELLKYRKQIIPSDFAMIKTFFLGKKQKIKLHRSTIKSDGKIYKLEYFGV